MELGYLSPAGNLVIVDTIGWRTLFPAFRVNPIPATVEHLGRPLLLERRRDVAISVRLHRKGFAARGEVALRRTQAMWQRGTGLDVFVGLRARRSIRAPWRGEFAKVHRPFFALEAPIKDLLEASQAHGSSPSVVWLDRSTVRGCRRSGRTVEVYAVERKEFSDFVLGRLHATIEFASEEDAAAFSDGLPPAAPPAELDAKSQPDITRSKRARWTPKTLAMAVGLVLLSAFSVAGVIGGTLEGKYLDVARVFVPLVLGLVVVAAALQLLLRVRRREFLDLVDKWPRVLCERWGKDYRAQSARAEEVLKSLGVRTGPDLSSVDAVLRSLPPETFYGTLALQIGLLAIDRLTRLVGRGFDFWWEYLPDRRECAFRVEAASRRLYPLTAVMTLWQQRDPEGLDPFVRTYGRDLQMRLAFAETLPALVALGFTAQGWDAFSKFAPRVEGELSGRGRVVAYPDASGGLRERVLGCGPVDLAIVEEPVEGEMTGRLVPTFAYPFAAQPGTTHLSLERSEDSDAPIAILPLGGQDNEIAARLTPSALKAAGIAPARIDCEICGVLDTARTLAHPEIEAPGARVPSSEPEESGEDETASPVNVLTARVLEVSEGVNPLNESRLLRIVLDLGSFRLPVLARTDLWQQAPRPGDVLQGTAWVFVRLPPPA